MTSFKCSAPCKYRTYGKYRRSHGKFVLNRNCKAEGTCAVDKIRISEDGKCLTFTSWDELEVSS